MKKETHEKMKKAQLFIAASLLFISLGLMFNNPGITGHFSADFKTQTLDIRMDQSQSYSIATDSSDSIYLSSLRLSGNIQGYGSVKIYIEDRGQRFLIYDNARKKEQGLPAVTGMAVAYAAEDQPVESLPEEKFLMIDFLENIRWEGRITLAADEEYTMGVFNNKCADTCFIEMPLSSKERYKLIFMIEPGTVLDISKMIYTLKDEIVEVEDE